MIFNIFIDYPLIFLAFAIYYSYELLVKHIKQNYTIDASIENDVMYLKRRNGLIMHRIWESWFYYYEMDNSIINSFKDFEYTLNKKKTKKANQIKISFTYDHELSKNIRGGNVFINPKYAMHKDAILVFLNERYSTTNPLS